MFLICNGVETAQKRTNDENISPDEGHLPGTLAQLKRLAGPEQVTQALRVMKERETGKLCYQAEEDLPSTELSLRT